MEFKTRNGKIYGDLTMPPNNSCIGICIFAHGSGSSRHSPRNQYSAKILNSYGFSTLLLDLLTIAESEKDEFTREYRFDIDLLANRILDVIDDLKKRDELKSYPVMIFGASTGAAAALLAASKTTEIKCVVSRGGRPDLVSKPHLESIKIPVLLLVGGYDTEVIEMNKDAYRNLGTKDKKLEIIPEATHLFPEPGKLLQVSKRAAEFMKEISDSCHSKEL